MIRENVASSNLFAIGYDADAQILEVEFTERGGRRAVWSYHPVSADTYAELRASESIGSAFHRLVKAAAVGTRLEDVIVEPGGFDASPAPEGAWR